MDWFPVFVVGRLIEVPIYTHALRDARFSRGKRIAAALAISAMTFPIVWSVFPVLFPDSYVALSASSKAFAVVVEAACLRVLGTRLYFSWSLVANALDFSLIVLLRRLIGWP